MPSLPRKNTLDYNPDSMINASKKIRTIALENMKNPTIDPDQATLSTLDATRRLGDSIDTLDYLAGLFHSAVLRIQNLVAPVVGAGRKKRAVSGVDAIISPNKGIDSSSSSGSSSVYSLSDFGGYNRRLEALKDQRNRFSGNFQIGDQNPQARSVSSGSSGSLYPSSSASSGSSKGSSSSASSGSSSTRFLYDPMNDRSVSALGDDTTLTGYAYNRGRDFESDDGGSDPRSIDVGDYDNTSWVASIFYLIQLTRKMDILVVSKIKPATNSLTQSQVDKLNDIYRLVKTSYDDITDPFTRRRGKSTDPYTRVERNIDEGRAYGMTNIEEHLIRQNEYGDEIINTFNSERKKLLLDITVVVNSWKQNSATGQQTEMAEDLTRDYENTAVRNRQLYVDTDIPNPQGGGGGDYDQVGAGRRRSKKSGGLHLLGAGNNFYGEKIDDSNDIPCLLSSIKNCPTKYLL
jgi:hypothetical protein